MKRALEPSAPFLKEARRRIGLARGRGVPSGRWRRVLPGSAYELLAWLMLVIAAAWTATLAPGVRHAANALLALIVATLAAGIFGRRHPHHVPFAMWPADQEAVFHRFLRRDLRTAAGLCTLFAIGQGFAAAQLHPVPNPLLAVVQGLASGLGLLVLVVVLAWMRHRWSPLRRYLALLIFAGLGVLGAFVPMDTGTRALVLEWLDGQGAVLAALAPTGWLTLAWSAWVEGGPWLHAWFLLPLGLTLAALPHAYSELRRFSRHRDAVLYEFFGELPEEAPEELGEAVHQARVAYQAMNAPGPTANADAILDRSFLLSPLRDPVRRADRWAWRWWTPAQRLVAETMNRAWPASATARWIGLGAVPIAWMGSWLAARNGFEKGWMLLGTIAAHATAVLALAPWISPFQGTRMIHALPIRLLDVAWLRWKHTAARSWLALMVLPPAGAVSLWMAGEPPWMGAIEGLQLALAPWVISPFATVYGLLNNRRHRGFLALVAMGCTAAGGILNIALLLVAFFPVAGIAVELVVVACNLALLLLVNRWLHRLRLDASIQVEAG